MVTELTRFPAASTMAEYRSPPHPPDRRSAAVKTMRLHRNIIDKSSTTPTSLPPNPPTPSPPPSLFTSLLRCAAAPTYFQIAPLSAHRAGTSPRIADLQLWAPSSPPYQPAHWGRSKYQSIHRHSSAGPGSATTGWLLAC